MSGRLLKMSLVALALVVTTSPAWAGYYDTCIKVYLEGVDRCGCLTCRGGKCADFQACINTCSGRFTGKACGCVENCTHCGPLVYKCKNFFCDPCWYVCVSSSCYTVCKSGACTYAACGTVY
jgi:hypothetical protein